MLLEVNQGTDSARAAGDAFAHILNKVRSAAEQMYAISVTSQQMSAGTEQMTASLNEIGELTSKVGGMVRQVTESSAQQQQLILTTSDLAQKLEEHSSALDGIIDSTRRSFSIS